MTTLDELRRANLQEQRRKAEAAAAQPVAEAPTPAPQPKASVEAKSQPVEAPKRETRPAPPEPAAVQAVENPVQAAAEKIEAPLEAAVAHLNGNGHASAEREVVETMAPVVDDVPGADGPVVDEADRKARAIMDRFYRGLAHKVVHPTGVKTTVDMPPDLFWRVKRYCHDHNNVTVRQLFLDLVIAVLEEEGY